MSSINPVGMPKACISCANFTPLGKKKDAQLPADLQPRFGKSGSWPFGMCSKAKAHVWGTELCRGFEPELDVQVIEVTKPRQARYEPRTDSLI